MDYYCVEKSVDHQDLAWNEDYLPSLVDKANMAELVNRVSFHPLQDLGIREEVYYQTQEVVHIHLMPLRLLPRPQR